MSEPSPNTQVPSQPSQPSQVAQPIQPQQQLTPEQQEFMSILNDLILSAQELSYALAVVDQSIIERHPELKELIEAARSVVRNVWRFHKFVKTRTRGARS